jgi:hypothetical protein
VIGANGREMAPQKPGKELARLLAKPDDGCYKSAWAIRHTLTSFAVTVSPTSRKLRDLMRADAAVAALVPFYLLIIVSFS